MLRKARLVTLMLVFISAIQTNFAQQKAITVSIDFFYEGREEYIKLDLFSQNNIDPTQISFTAQRDTTFQLGNLPSDVYFIRITSIGEENLRRDLDLIKNDSLKVKFSFPIADCGYDKQNKKCPFGHKNRVVKIWYSHSRLTMLLDRIGIIKMGGDILMGCDPNYYCKKHKLRF